MAQRKRCPLAMKFLIFAALAGYHAALFRPPGQACPRALSVVPFLAVLIPRFLLPLEFLATA